MKAIGHHNFITTPISSIIEETNKTCLCLGNGIEIYPLASYIMQTTFLRMTGASEQKLKCICWEIATFDYEFRYRMLQKPHGECSSYDDKRKIYDQLQEFLKRYDEPPSLSRDEKQNVIKMATTELDSILNNKAFEQIFEREMHEYRRYRASNTIPAASFGNDTGKKEERLLNKMNQEYYKNYVYRYRNRYAHNLTSYQANVPSLTQLCKADAYKNNHFRMFSMLILLDGIFMTMYDKFLRLKNQHCY